MLTKLKDYVVSSYVEARKVSWPTKQQTINYSVLVLALSIGMALFFALLDYGFNRAITQLLTK